MIKASSSECRIRRTFHTATSRALNLCHLAGVHLAEALPRVFHMLGNTVRAIHHLGAFPAQITEPQSARSGARISETFSSNQQSSFAHLWSQIDELQPGCWFIEHLGENRIALVTAIIVTPHEAHTQGLNMIAMGSNARKSMNLEGGE
jgi:hypothetical protein